MIEKEEMEDIKCPFNWYKDITYEKKDIRIKNILIEDYESLEPFDFKVNHRPLLSNQVKGIRETYFDLDRDIVVIWSSKDHKFRIVDGKQHFHSLKLLIKEGKVKKIKRYPSCKIIVRKSTGKRLDYELKDDRKLANGVSFIINSNQRRTCMIDIVVRVWNLCNDYQLTNNTKHGMYEYIRKNGLMGKDYTNAVLQKYYMYGNALEKYGLLDHAQKDRARFGTEALIMQEIAKAKKSPIQKKLYKMTISLSGKTFGFFKPHKNDSKYWDTVSEIVKEKTAINRK